MTTGLYESRQMTAQDVELVRNALQAFVRKHSEELTIAGLDFLFEEERVGLAKIQKGPASGDLWWIGKWQVVFEANEVTATIQYSLGSSDESCVQVVSVEMQAKDGGYTVLRWDYHERDYGEID